MLHEGLRNGLPRYLDQGLLSQHRPVLRALAGHTLRTMREDAGPQLASRTRAAS
ncbi:hypothetical protein ABZ424_34185 [Streptomyces sp. NPDC005790]|uniref:hypothetical protein n=1 Tax=Streptomyces sp. NPDC005790 TaxID=3154777 RepID=UPI0033DCA520